MPWNDPELYGAGGLLLEETGSETRRKRCYRPAATDLHHLLPLSVCDVRPIAKPVTNDAPISLATLI